MPELCISIALVAIGGMGLFGWLKWVQLAHGRMLSADRSQTFERAITQLETRVKQLNDAYDTLQTVALTGRQRIEELQAQHNQIVDSFQAIKASEAETDVVLEGHAKRLADYGHALSQDAQRFAGLTDWQKTCERSIELLQADIDKRDKAITNVAEEVAGLQRQQALALMGIAKTPKHGYAPGGPK